MKTLLKLLSCAVCTLLFFGCNAALTDVVLSIWDLDGAIEAADSISMSITTDEKITEVRSLESDLNIGSVKTLADNGVVSFDLEASASPFDVVGRSGLVRPVLKEDGLQTIDASMIVAQPGVFKRISPAPTDARSDVTVCQAKDDRIFVISGFSGALARSNFVLDPHERSTVSGPELNEGRRLAACVTDNEGGLYLFGGCDQGDAATGGLLFSNDGSAQSPFEAVETFASAGCDVEMLQREQGPLILNTGTTLHTYSEGSLLPETLTLNPARFGATMVNLPGSNNFVIAGGKNENGDDNSDTLLVVHDGAAFFAGNTFSGTLAAPTKDGVALFVSGDVVTLDENGTTPLLNSVVSFEPTQMVSLPGERFAFMDSSGGFIEVVGPQSTRISLDVARPSGTLVADRGGALFVVGGGVPGIDVVVLP